MALINKDKKYKWEYVNLGGSTRVKINSGEDLAHLKELDPKMWTVLSCPTTGLEIDDKSLKYMDCDGDGKLRINDVVSVSQWITSVLKNKDLLLVLDVKDFLIDKAAAGSFLHIREQDGLITTVGNFVKVLSAVDHHMVLIEKHAIYREGK